MAKRIFMGASGGISNNSKSGLADSARFLKHLNIFTDNDSITLNPQPVKISASTVVDLPLWITSGYPYTTDKFAYGDTGTIYKINSSDVVTSLRTVSNSTGQGMEVFIDAVWYAGNKTLGQYYPLSGTPAFTDNLFDNGTDNLDLSVTASGQTYTPPTSISESATNRCTITPTKDPLKTISIYVTAKGTGNWTITLHDSVNNSLGTSTIANGSLTNAAMNDFDFTTPCRIVIGQDYHFHVTSTVADGTMQTSGANDEETAQYNTYFDILIDTTYHDIKQHTNGVGGTIVITNEHYIAELTQAGVYNPNKIVLPPAYSARFFVRDNDFIVAMCTKGADNDSFEDGMAFWWDGVQPYYNFSKPITGGLPNAGINYKNRVFSVLGNDAIMTLGTEPFLVVQPVPLMPNNKKVEVIPGGITTWQNRVHIAIGANATDSTTLVQGIYEFGNNSDRALSSTDSSSEVLNHGYTMSTGDEQGTTLKYGAVNSFGTALYFGWKSQAGTFGIDKASRTGNPASTASYESLVDDYATDAKGNLYHAPQKLKRAGTLAVAYQLLPAGVTVTPKYRIDGAASWTLGTGTDIGIAGTYYCLMNIDQEYYFIEYGYDVVATVNYPVFTGLFYEFNGAAGERDTGN